MLELQMFLSKIFGYCVEWKNVWLSQLSLFMYVVDSLSNNNKLNTVHVCVKALAGT